MYYDGSTYVKVSKERWILAKTGLSVWQNKTLDQMTDQDCIDCLRYIYSETGTSYVIIGGDTEDLWLKERKQ